MAAQADPQGVGYAGQLGLTTDTSEFNKHYFLVQQILGRVRTLQLVKVMGATNAGEIAPPGFIDVMLLVNQIDGLGNSTPHETIFQIPYVRMQGGANAVIMDPVAGDIGWAGFADRDISAVVRAKQQANPGSRRRFDLADGVYIGAVLNGTPTQYIAFAAGGIAMVSPSKITLQAPDIEFVGPTHTTGAVTGDSTAIYQGDVKGSGTDLHTHVHGGVSTGSGDTGPPV